MDDSMTMDKVTARPAVQSVKADLHAMQDNRFVSLLTLFGFACFWACIACTVVGNFFFPELVANDKRFLLHFLLLFGLALAQWIYRLSLINRLDSITFRRFACGICLTIGILFTLINAFSTTGLISSLIALSLSWLFLGMSMGITLILWGSLWTSLDAERPNNHGSAVNVSLSIILSAILCLFMVFAPALIAIIAMEALYIISLLLQLYCFTQLLAPETIDSDTSLRRLKLFSRNLLTPLTVGLILGATLAICTSVFNAEVPLVFFLSSLVIGGIAVWALLTALRRTPRFSTVERIAFPIIGGCLLLLPYCEGLILNAAVILISAASVFYFTFHWNILVALSYRHHVQPAFHYAQGLIAPLGSVVIGWGLVYLLSYVLDIPPSSITLPVSLAAVFLLLLELAIVPSFSNKMTETVFIDSDDGEKEEVGSWRTRCHVISIEYGLTPREQEVFLLLAKGRNTEIVADKLIISTHTVKTHTSRIYRKLSINSQQELIDIVEGKKL
jgi:DNA-binding CsgD family transcriptional regulator